MNVFVRDLTVEYVVTHMQGYTSGILIILVRNWMNVWLTCTVNVYSINLDFTLISLKCLSLQ